MSKQRIWERLPSFPKWVWVAAISSVAACGISADQWEDPDPYQAQTAGGELPPEPTEEETVRNPLAREFGDEPAQKVAKGRASYYHDSLAGNHTANGEIYDPQKYTAANRTLPFGTVVRVIRLDTGRSVLVRVNDRGPFGSKRRILDLSRAAAEHLDMIAAGVVPIRAEIVGRSGPM